MNRFKSRVVFLAGPVACILVLLLCTWGLEPAEPEVAPRVAGSEGAPLLFARGADAIDNGFNGEDVEQVPSTDAIRIASMLDDRGGPPSLAVAEAYARMRTIAKNQGIIAPRTITGPIAMWSALEEVDRLYVKPLVTAHTTYANRLFKHLRDKGSSAEMRVLDSKDLGRKTPIAISREFAKHADDNPPAIVNRDGKHYVASVKPGVDAKLDETNRERIALRALATESFVHILRSHNVNLVTKTVR